MEYCKCDDQFINKDKCDEGLIKVTRWISSLKEESKKRTVQLRLDEEKTLLSKKDITRFYTCDGHKSAVELLKSIQRTGTASMIDQTSVSAIRNHLILWLLPENGHRSGAVINATVQEFNEAEVADEEHRVMRVKKHKTFSTYGPCNIVISNEVYEYLRVWVDCVRPVLSAKVSEEERDEGDRTTLFLGFTRKCLKEQNLARQLMKYTEQTLGVSNVTATKIRKSLVVMVSSAIVFFSSVVFVVKLL